MHVKALGQTRPGFVSKEGTIICDVKASVFGIIGQNNPFLEIAVCMCTGQGHWLLLCDRTAWVLKTLVEILVKMLLDSGIDPQSVTRASWLHQGTAPRMWDGWVVFHPTQCFKVNALR
jgi:hypothetical protein